MTEVRFANTVPQVAEGFGRSELTIRRCIKRDWLRAERIGGSWYIPAEEVDIVIAPAGGLGRVGHLPLTRARVGSKLGKGTGRHRYWGNLDREAVAP
jgi:hypothetical protein